MGIDQTNEEASISAAQTKRLYTIATNNGWTHEGVKELLWQNFRIQSAKELTRAQYDKVCEHLQTSILPNVVTMRCEHTRDLFDSH